MANWQIITTLICQSHTDNRLSDLYPQWYGQKKKVIPKHLLKFHFNVDFLAIWFQDDGSLKSKSRIILSTECFQHQELLFLQKLLMERFSLQAHIDTQNRLDISSRQDVELFHTYVSPFLSLGMKRKSLSEEHSRLQNETIELLTKCKTFHDQVPCRTTIYLPPALKRFLQDSPSPSKKLSHLLQIKTELLNINLPTLRRQRIIQSKNMIATETQKVSYTIHINAFHFNTLKLLKKWTGIGISNYIQLLLKDVS